MEAVLKTKANKFSNELINKIKSLMPNNDYTVTISISNNVNESYVAKLDEAITALKNNEGSTFTLETLEEFIRQN